MPVSGTSGGMEERDYTRFEAHLQAIVDSEEGEGFLAATRDISQSGCRLVKSRSRHIGQPLKLRLLTGLESSQGIKAGRVIRIPKVVTAWETDSEIGLYWPPGELHSQQILELIRARDLEQVIADPQHRKARSTGQPSPTGDDEKELEEPSAGPVSRSRDEQFFDDLAASDKAHFVRESVSYYTPRVRMAEKVRRLENALGSAFGAWMPQALAEFGARFLGTTLFFASTLRSSILHLLLLGLAWWSLAFAVNTSSTFALLVPAFLIAARTACFIAARRYELSSVRHWDHWLSVVGSEELEE